MDTEVTSRAGNQRARKVAEEVLGKPLPDFAVVHHIDEDSLNNEHSNLVICEDETYHRLLHQRAKALKACGHTSWRKCSFCEKYDNPENLVIHEAPTWTVYHRSCMNQNHREYRKQKKASLFQ